jgi:hypothetical protein
MDTAIAPYLDDYERSESILRVRTPPPESEGEKEQEAYDEYLLKRTSRIEKTRNLCLGIVAIIIFASALLAATELAENIPPPFLIYTLCVMSIIYIAHVVSYIRSKKFTNSVKPVIIPMSEMRD